MRLEREQDAGLQRIGVLVFVHQDMVEARADLRREYRFGHHLRPVQQQVVVVEHVLFLLGLHIGEEQLLEFVLPFGAPREAALQHFFQRQQGVDRGRVDRETGVLQRKALRLAGCAQLMPHQVHEVGRVAAVVDGEAGVEAYPAGVFAQQARADAVEGSGPVELGTGKPRAVSRKLAHDALGTPRHLIRRAAREGQQQDSSRIGALRDDMGDAVCKGIGLAGTGTGNHQQRFIRSTARAVLYGNALCGVEA